MVRFIIFEYSSMNIAEILIYIPLWLDLLFLVWKEFSMTMKNLHSTMVRFII